MPTSTPKQPEFLTACAKLVYYYSLRSISTISAFRTSRVQNKYCIQSLDNIKKTKAVSSNNFKKIDVSGAGAQYMTSINY